MLLLSASIQSWRLQPVIFWGSLLRRKENPRAQAHQTPLRRVEGVLVLRRTTLPGDELNQYLESRVLPSGSFPGTGLVLDPALGLRPGRHVMFAKNAATD